MAVTIASEVTFSAIKPKIGSVVHADKAALLSGDHAATLMDMLEQRGVLVFPRIGFTDAEHVAFTATLGRFTPDLGGKDLYPISVDKQVNETAEYLLGAFYWHFDGYMSPMPIRASLLASKVLSPPGTGNTEFANTYAAYEALSDADKARLADLRVAHTMAHSQLSHTPEPTQAQWDEWRALGRKDLPLVWTHASGRKSLVLGNAAAGVLGMDPVESTDLLVRLRNIATREEFTYSHCWRVGDLVMWDNTGTLHRATAYPFDCGRLLHRTKLEGEEPIA
ncbi:MAG: TauD/TfdA family dioxygenase [Sphingomonadales bacterium]|nr:TauD/TfdA family dioxygenase [Sphingomonadales bacterium]